MVKLGSIATKTIGLYLMTTGIAVSMALIFGYIFNLSGYEGDVRHLLQRLETQVSMEL